LDGKARPAPQYGGGEGKNVRTEWWPWTDGECALYTESPEAPRVAKDAGLRLIGEYFNVWRPEAGVYARQYVGPKEAVLAAARALRGRKAG
jgi:hypothetical protein